jgi:hypothetical protein
MRSRWTAPTGLPMKKGRASTMTHDYKRHGTTTLLAGLTRVAKTPHCLSTVLKDADHEIPCTPHRGDILRRHRQHD